MAHKYVIFVAVVVSGTFGFAYAGRGADPVDPSYFKGNYTYAEAQAFSDYPVYAPGPEFASLPLTSIERRLTDPVEFHSYRTDNLSFVYGDCTTSESRCTPPIEVQTWRACELHPEEYEADADSLTLIRGVPARWYEEGRHVELYTADVVVIIWGETQAQVLGLVDSLKLVNAENFPYLNTDPLGLGLLPPADDFGGGSGDGCDRSNVTPDGGAYDVDTP